MPADFATHIVETATGRHIAYRRGGDGPPVVLLHESPRSSAALMALGQRLASRFTVFALDTPAFGLSDDLDLTRPTAADFADALAEALDCLGLDAVPLYGTHTGAVIAASFALRYPQRTRCLVLDGYACFTEAEQAEYLASYLTPIAPDWSGAHLAWLWSRVKDQFSFFPWYLRADAARLPRPPVPLDVMQGVIVDLLSAGDRYRGAYAAAFRFDAVQAAARIAVPTVYACRADDLLFGHLDRLPPLPSSARIQSLAADRDAWGNAIGVALGAGAGGSAPPVPRGAMPGTGTARPSRRVIHTAHASLGIAAYGRSGTPPIVLLHELPGCARGVAELARRLSIDRDVIAIDLPGYGVSRLHEVGSAENLVRALLEGLDALGVASLDLVAVRESGTLAAQIAQRAAGRVRRLVLIDPVPESPLIRRGLATAFVDVAPRMDGTHLLAAWHQLRDAALWKPWTERSPATMRRFGVDPDVARLDAVLTEWMRGGTTGAATAAIALADPLEQILDSCRASVTIVSHPGHAWHSGATALAQHAKAQLLTCSDDWDATAVAVRGLA